MNLALIGAESYHARAFGEIFNVFRLVRGVRVTHIWGETEELAREKALIGQVPHLVSHPEEVLGQVDGALILLRDGGRHLAAARPFLKAGVPVFVDKPVANTVRDVRALLRLREQAGVPIMTGSSIPLQRSALAMKAAVKQAGTLLAAQIVGPGTLENEWGGGATAKDWTPAMRADEQGLLAEVRGLEEQALQALAEATAKR